MNIVFSVNNGEEVKILPVVPRDIEIAQNQNNEEFQTINNGTLHLIGDIGLRTLQISSIFPSQEYRWLKKGSSADAMGYIEFFKKCWKMRVPIRIVMTDEKEDEYLNMPCIVDSITYSKLANGDIRYTMEIKEYKFVNLNV